MNKKILIVLAILLAVILVAVGVEYLITPANRLPSFFPGYDPTAAKLHAKHGLAALLLAAGSVVFAWFQSGPKSKQE